MKKIYFLVSFLSPLFLTCVDECYLIRSDDHDMAKAMVLTAEIMDAVMDMAGVMVTCRISVQDPMRKIGLPQFLHLTIASIWK